MLRLTRTTVIPFTSQVAECRSATVRARKYAAKRATTNAKRPGNSAPRTGSLLNGHHGIGTPWVSPGRRRMF
jgi:hypothetical protein